MITRDIIEDLEDKGIVKAIYPSEELHVGNLEKDMSVVDHVYEVGYKDGLELVSEVKKFLGGKVNEKKGR